MLMTYKPAMVLLGSPLPDANSLEILQRIQQKFPQSKTILFSAFQDMDTTIQAMKSGAYDYVLEDIDFQELDRKIQKAIRIFSLHSGQGRGYSRGDGQRDSQSQPTPSSRSSGCFLLGRSRRRDF